MKASEHHVRRFRTRYRLPANMVSSRPRLDRITRVMLDDALPIVLRTGSMQSDIICVRKLIVPFRMTLRGSDATIAAYWAHALREQLDRTLAEGRDVVRYTSLAHVLVDFALAVLRGDERRTWAYRQLELWSDEAPHGLGAVPPSVAQLLVALSRHGELIPAVLSELGRRGALSALNTSFVTREEGGTRAWVLLARHALKAFGVDGDLLEGDAAMRDDGGSPEADRVAKASTILAKLRGAARPKRPEDRSFWARALASLAILETEPGALHRSRVARSRVARLASMLTEAKPSHRSTVGGEAGKSRALSSPDEAGARPVASVDAAGEASQQDIGATVVEVRTTATTRFGGLLFLLHVVGELDLPAGRLVEPPLDCRSLRWCLYRLAHALAPMEDSDPAARAFAGIEPHGTPPDHQDHAFTDRERDAISAVAFEVEAQACNRLKVPHDPAVVRSLVLRQATIFADPGWIEVRFSLDDVSTEVRRAGLDLDPGFLPWLGAVVRFCYD